jgi:hypothetical protein
MLGAPAAGRGVTASPQGPADLGDAADRLVDGVNQVNPIYAVAVQTIECTESIALRGRNV